MIEQKQMSSNLDLEKYQCPPPSRRSRKDQEGRDFQCGCGKRYLSYPALYTHIKTKHNGQQPQGTQKNCTTNLPKKIKPKLDDQTLKGLTNHVDKTDIKLLQELDENMIGSVSLNSRFKKDHTPKEIYEQYIALTKQPELTLCKTSTLDRVLAIYLFNIGEFINDKLYDHYLLFSRLLRHCYNQHGEQVYKACFSKQNTKPYLSFFANGQIQYLPLICDYFLRFFIPNLENSKESKDINLSLMELILSDFCNWLFKKQLTRIKVTLKKQYRLETKPVPLPRHRTSQKEKDKEAKEGSLSDSKKEEEEDHSFEGSDMEEDQEQESHSSKKDQDKISNKAVGDPEQEGLINPDIKDSAPNPLQTILEPLSEPQPDHIPQRQPSGLQSYANEPLSAPLVPDKVGPTIRYNDTLSVQNNASGIEKDILLQEKQKQ